MTKMSVSAIESAMKSEEIADRKAAMLACRNRNDVHSRVLSLGLSDPINVVRRAAVKACYGKKISFSVLEDWLSASASDAYREAAMMNCIDNAAAPFKLIERGLIDNNEKVRMLAADACKGKNIPWDTVMQWIESKDPCMRRAAVRAAQDRSDVPAQLVAYVVRDYAIEVTSIASELTTFLAEDARRSAVPEKVYQKCLNGAVAVAMIPSDAIIRGPFRNGEYRTNKATIVDIIGGFFGDKIGVSITDNSVCYRPGDQIVINYYDKSDAEYAAGFYFVTSLTETTD